MGAKAWFAAYYNGDPKDILARSPVLDRGASLAFAKNYYRMLTYLREKMVNLLI